MLAIDFTAAARGDDPTLRLAGALDLVTATTLARVLHAMTVRPGGRITLDIAQVRFCDGTGLGALLEAHRHVTRAGATLRVIRPSPPVRGMLCAAHCDWLLDDDHPPAATQERPAHTRLWLAHLRGRTHPTRPAAEDRRTSARLRPCDPAD